MQILSIALNVFLWPGNRFCESMGVSPKDDNGMLRGFINSLVWGIVLVIVFGKTL